MNLDEKAVTFLEKNHSAAMTTIRKDGSPHSVRVGVGLVEGRLWSSGTQSRARTKHLRRDPRCALFVFDPAYSYLVLDTSVTILDGPESADKATMVEEDRLIYGFEVKRASGLY